MMNYFYGTRDSITATSKPAKNTRTLVEDISRFLRNKCWTEELILGISLPLSPSMETFAGTLEKLLTSSFKEIFFCIAIVYASRNEIFILLDLKEGNYHKCIQALYESLSVL